LAELPNQPEKGADGDAVDVYLLRVASFSLSGVQKPECRRRAGGGPSALRVQNRRLKLPPRRLLPARPFLI